MFKKNKESSSSNNPNPVNSEPVTTAATQPTGNDTPPANPEDERSPEEISKAQAVQKEKLYAVSYLLKQNNMQLTEAPWCIGKTAMTEEEFKKGKDEWFNKDKKEETASPDDGNTEDNK